MLRYPATLVVCLSVAALANGQPSNAPYVPGRLLVQHRPGADATLIAQTFAANGLKVQARIDKLNVSVLNLPETAVAATTTVLQRSGLFSYVERDYLAHVQTTPNDPDYSSQWHLSTIQAPYAWNLTTGAWGTIIAIVDSGVDNSAQPDLTPKVLTGWNYVTGTSNTADTMGHGTAVAGTAAAATNNGVGVAGVAWQNAILPVVAVDSSGNASYSNLASAITYAADYGARIINVSVAGTAASSTLQNAVSYAWSKNAVVFAAAGNNSNSTPNYPAACTYAVAVSATDQNDSLASYSDYGSWITLAAPGSYILTTDMGGGYGYWSGTSLATPVAAGVAALVLSANPSLSASALVSLLEQNSDDLGAPGYDIYYGYGRVNAYRAVTAAAGGSSVAPATVSVSISPSSVSLSASQSQVFSASVSGSSNTSVTWSISPAVGTISGGVYTAPSYISSAQTVTVTATSAADPSKSASGSVALVPPVISTPTATSGTAAFVKADTSTQGNWMGSYGAAGYNVAGDVYSYPSSVTVTASGQYSYTWSSSTSDVRALEMASSPAKRIAAAWYSGAFTIDLSFSDTNIHPVAIYCLDWDYQGRAQSVVVTDGYGNTLDSRSMSGFSSGQYLVWNVTGHVKIQVTALAGPNAVVSGLFFGGGASSAPAPSPSPSSAAASFVNLDASTQGNWKGVYGGDGYSVIGDLSSYPGYVTATPAGMYSYTWAASSTYTRALEKASSSTDRIAAAWYSGSFYVDLNFTDGKTHQLAVYCLDWDYQGRSETLTITDTSGNTLDSRSISSFSGGQYLVWNLTGHVQLHVTSISAPNAVISGLFFGAGSGGGGSSTGPASFVALDTSTQGNWKGVYGTAGYNVIGDLTSYPSYVTVTPSYNSSYVWASSSTYTRALEKASSSTDRIAAAWYAGSFSIDVNFSDSNTHQLALYCLDWDYQARTESITITDAYGNTLDSRTVSNFSGGQYLVWNVSGHIKIQVAASSGPNAVISGLFFQ